MHEEDARARPLRVVAFEATKKGDADRGPRVRVNPDDARVRLLTDGELAWVHGPRRNQLAQVAYDDSLRKGDVVLRDISGTSPSELVRIFKPDLDTRGPRSDVYV